MDENRWYIFGYFWLICCFIDQPLYIVIYIYIYTYIHTLSFTNQNIHRHQLGFTSELFVTSQAKATGSKARVSDWGLLAWKNYSVFRVIHIYIYRSTLSVGFLQIICMYTYIYIYIYHTHIYRFMTWSDLRSFSNPEPRQSQTRWVQSGRTRRLRKCHPLGS